MNKKIIVYSIILILLASSLIIFSKTNEKVEQINHGENPCWYWVSNDSVKLWNINSSDVKMFQNKQGNFFFINNITEEELLECEK